MARKAKKETAAARWAAAAKAERTARREPRERRLKWLARPNVVASHSEEWLKAQVAACRGAMAAAKGKG